MKNRKEIYEIELSLKQLIVPGLFSLPFFATGFSLAFRYGLNEAAYILAIGAAILAPFVMQYMHTDLVLFENKIMGRTGIVNIRSVNVPLNKINGVVVQQGLIGHLLGYKTLVVSTSSNVVKFKKVVNADKFAEMALDQVDIFKRKEKEEEIAMLAKAMKQANE